MNNLPAIAIIVIVLGNAVWYILRQRKKGTKCIGCPSGGCDKCSSKNNCNQSF